MTRVLRRLALLAALGVAVAGIGSGDVSAARADVLSATVSTTPTGPVMDQGFLGVSLEYRAVQQYTGRDPRAVDPVLVSLIKGLAPGQSPVIRIGGNSADDTWWPIRGAIPPGGIDFSLTKGWLRTTQALAADTGAKLILGINLAAGRPAIAAAEGRALLSGIGRRSIDALEIGNEPDLYPGHVWFRDRRNHLYRRRARSYDLADYAAQFRQWSKVLPDVPLAGPAVSGPAWMKNLGTLIAREPRLKLVTYHRYPLRACEKDAHSPLFPTIANLLADRSSAGLASGMSPFVRTAAAHHLPFRVAEMNSASCEGAAGVSDTFASALWALDTMFNFAKLGVQGVNFHMLPGSHYELFTPSRTAAGGWQAFVHPEYYGLQMFAQAFPPGAQLLPVTAPAGPTKVWATQDANGTERVTLINQDPSAAHDVQVTIPGATETGTVETLSAPSLDATSGVTLGGLSYGAQTTTGTLAGSPVTTPAPSASGVYTVALAPGSAALLTLPAAGGGGTPLAR